MADKMLITQALDERGLLVKKIQDKIQKAEFVDTMKQNEDKVLDARVSREEFAKEAERAYQQIQDLIDRYQKIDVAIVASNARTKIQTSYGEFTVAGAISLRNRIRNNGYNGDTNFEHALQCRMESEFQKKLAIAEAKNKQLQVTAENMRLSILGKDTKVKDDKPLEVVEAYVRENTTNLVDPLDVQKKITGIQEKQDTLLTELDTQIKVSNATTFIEI